MKIRHKPELQQPAFTYSSDTKSEEFISVYKKCSGKPCSFLVTDTTLASDKPLRSNNNLFKII